MSEPDYYKILGVTPASSPSEIAQAWRRRVRDAHPDAGGDPEQFHLLQNAYSTLSDQQSRAEYDVARTGRRPSWLPGARPGRHAKSRRIKAWRIRTASTDVDATTPGAGDVMQRPWFSDINPVRRIRASPSAWRRGGLAAAVVLVWAAVSLRLVTEVLDSGQHIMLRALVIPYAMLIGVAVAVAASRPPRRPMVAAVVAAALSAAVIWRSGGDGLAWLAAAHLLASVVVPWTFIRFRAALRLRGSVRAALRDFNAFGPSGSRPSADRRTGAILRSLLEHIPAARLFVRVPVGGLRAEYTVVCGHRVAIITPPVPRAPTDTGAESLPGVVEAVTDMLDGTRVRGFVVWPHLPPDRISGADAVVRHLSAPEATAEIGRWLACEPYTLHLPTLRRLRDRLAGGQYNGNVPTQTERDPVGI